MVETKADTVNLVVAADLISRQRTRIEPYRKDFAGDIACIAGIPSYLENMGFVADDLFTRPMTLLPSLFAGAFYAHHRGMKRKDIDEIFNAMTNRSELITKLVEMYREPIATLTEEPEEGEGNVSWTASF